MDNKTKVSSEEGSWLEEIKIDIQHSTAEKSRARWVQHNILTVETIQTNNVV
jgi:hypothetical protein